MNREDQLDQMIRDLLMTSAETELYDSVNERAFSSSTSVDANLKSEASTEDHPSRWKEFFNAIFQTYGNACRDSLSLRFSMYSGL